MSDDTTNRIRAQFQEIEKQVKRTEEFLDDLIKKVDEWSFHIYTATDGRISLKAKRIVSVMNRTAQFDIDFVFVLDGHKGGPVALPCKSWNMSFEKLMASMDSFATDVCDTATKFDAKTISKLVEALRNNGKLVSKPLTELEKKKEKIQ